MATTKTANEFVVKVEGVTLSPEAITRIENAMQSIVLQEIALGAPHAKKGVRGGIPPFAVFPLQTNGKRIRILLPGEAKSLGL